MKIKCKECDNIQDAESSLKKEWTYVDGCRLQVTYFVCNKCKELHIVQLDDEQSIMSLEEVGRKLKKVADCNVKGKTPKKRTTNGLKKKNKELSRLRKVLLDIYSGKGKVIAINGRITRLDVEMQEYVDQGE